MLQRANMLQIDLANVYMKLNCDSCIAKASAYGESCEVVGGEDCNLGCNVGNSL
jgi:hypothetical protein